MKQTIVSSSKLSLTILLLILLAGIQSCKFNDPTDLTALPEVVAPGLGLHDAIPYHMDTLHGSVIVPIPDGLTKVSHLVMPELGVYLPFFFHNEDSSIIVEVNYTNRLSEGAITEDNLSIASSEIEAYLIENQYADVTANEFIQLNGQEFWHFEADLNWNGKRLSNTIYATIKNGFITVYNMRYPSSNREDSEVIRAKFPELIVWL